MVELGVNHREFLWPLSGLALAPPSWLGVMRSSASLRLLPVLSNSSPERRRLGWSGSLLEREASDCRVTAQGSAPGLALCRCG